MSSSAYLWVLSPLLHTPYTSSPNHYHPFATHVHTIVTCFAVAATLCPLFLVSLSQLLIWNSIFQLHATHPPDRSHLCPLSFLTGQVSLPCNILRHTQLLCSFPLLINDISLLVSKVTNCLNLFHPTRILASTAASASPSTLSIVTQLAKLIH